jgi:hypothetical protein
MINKLAVKAGIGLQAESITISRLVFTDPSERRSELGNVILPKRGYRQIHISS